MRECFLMKFLVVCAAILMIWALFSIVAEDNAPHKTASRETVRKKPTVVPKPVWRTSKYTSKIDDSTNVYITRKAVYPVLNRRSKLIRPEIAIACRENKTSLWIDFDGEFMADLDHGTITYRIDKNKARRRAFRESNDHSALGLWNGGTSIPFIKELMAGKDLVIRATPHSESELEVEFDISELDQTIKPLRQACNW